MQGAVSEEQYREFLKVFQAFHTPSDLAAIPLMTSPLVQQARQQQPTLLPHQALQAAFTEIIEVLAAENQIYADLLQGRFWEGQSIEAMVATDRPLPMSKRTFSNYQRSAIQTFAFLFLQAEQNLQSQTAATATSAPTTGAQATVQAAPLFVDQPAPQPSHPMRAEEGLNAPGATEPVTPAFPPAHQRAYWALGAGLLVTFLLIGLLLARPVGNWFGKTPVAAPALLFSDDFEAGASQWNNDSAAWTIEADESGNHFYCVTQAEPAYTYAVAGSTTWQDYTLQLDLKIIQSAPGGSGNLLWRVTEANAAHYLMGILAEAEGNGFTLAREDPTYQPLGQSLNQLPRQSWTAIRVEVVAGEIQIFIGENTLPALQVTDPAPIAQGGIGLGAGFDPNAPDGQWKLCFDNVRVTEKSAPE